MKTNVEALEGDQIRLTVTVEKEEIDSRISKTYKDFARKYKFPGFRPGKAPRPVIDSVLGREAVLATVTDEATNENFPLALDAEDLVPIDDPNFENATELVVEHEDFSFSATMTLPPTFELSNYEPVDIKLPSEEPTEEEIDERLEVLREYYYDLVDAEADEPIGERGCAELSLDVKDDKGNPVNVLSTDHRLYELGMGLYPSELDEALVELKTGDEKTVEVDLGSSMGALLTRALDGNPEALTIGVTVHQVKKKELPEISEEFAKEKAGFDSLEDLRRNTKDNIVRERKELEPRMKENACLYKLAERLEGEAPEQMCADERRTLMTGFFQQLTQQGITFDAYLNQRGLTNEQFQDDLKRQARDVVTQNLALDAYARHFDVQVTQEQIDHEFEQSGAEDVEALKADWVANGRIRMLRQSLRRANAADKLMEEASVERVTAEEYRAQTILEEIVKDSEDAATEEAAPEAEADGKKVTKTELNKLKVAELRDKAAEAGIEAEGLKKAELVDALYEALNA